ncbi:hypothetical protein YW3DRAFT_03380 [Streptomyces sp. MnatMP-M77]|nr:hypothetical protein YW3DRAFT_03380 [Streptomyces sp. MnatMP-M77]
MREIYSPAWTATLGDGLFVGPVLPQLLVHRR